MNGFGHTRFPPDNDNMFPCMSLYYSSYIPFPLFSEWRSLEKMAANDENNIRAAPSAFKVDISQ